MFTTLRAAPFASMIWMSVMGSERRREPMLDRLALRPTEDRPEPDAEDAMRSSVAFSWREGDIYRTVS